MLRVLISIILFLYDFLSFPVYLCLQYIWDLKDDRFGPVKVVKTTGPGYVGVKQGTSNANKNYQEVIVGGKVETVYKAWKNTVSKFQDRECFGTREVFGEEDEKQSNGKVFKKLSLGNYQWTSYNHAWTASQGFGKGLRELGLQPGDKIAIYAETREEWIVSALGAFAQNITVCTLYTNLGTEAVAYGINETEVKLVVTSGDLMPNMEKILALCPRVENVVYFKHPLLSVIVPEIKSPVTFTKYENVVLMGSTSKFEDSPPGSQDIAIIMYTSGSTGVPKGVLLSHGNIISTVAAMFHLFPFNSSDVYLAYLPLAHIFEILSEVTMMTLGITIGFSTPQTFNDSGTKIKKGEKGDVSLLRPTIMCGVPLMLDRIYKSIDGVLKKKGKNFGAAFSLAYDYKLFWKRQGYSTPILDRLLFDKLKNSMGGRIRFLLCGSAPLAPKTHEFVRLCLDTTLMQGYSMTESCCSGVVMEPIDYTVGKCGVPLAGTEIRLVDWDEGNYRITDKPLPRGEILVGSHSISMGYYKNETKTAEDYFVENGVRFFRTGDIGELDQDGKLKIIDRKKDLVKLQFGEYVSLGKVESQLKNHPIVENICVYADSFHTYTIAIISPDRVNLEALAEKAGVLFKSFEELCSNSSLLERVTKLLGEHGKKSGLEKFEIPTKVYICPEQWSPESGLVTAAFKIKRKPIQAKFQSNINLMYNITS